MKIIITSFLSLLFFFTNQICEAQKKYEDSLHTIIKTTNSDTTRISTQMKLMDLMEEDEEWNAINLSIEKECREKISKEKGKRLEFFLNALGTSVSNKAFYLSKIGQQDNELKLENEALNYFLQSGNQDGIGTMYNNMAVSYNRQGNVNKALEFYKKALEIYKKVNSEKDIGITLSNLATVSYFQNLFEESINYSKEALPLLEKQKDKKSYGRCLINLSGAYKSMGDTVSMRIYLMKGLKVQEECGDLIGLTATYNNLGVLNSENKKYQTSKYYCLKALKIRREIKDQRGISQSLTNYAKLLLRENKLDSVRIVLDESFLIATKVKYPELIQNIHEEYYKLESELKNYADALFHYKRFYAIKDSLINDKNKKTALKQQMQHEYDKKEAILFLEQEKKDLQNREKLKLQALEFQFQQEEIRIKSKAEKDKLAQEEQLKREKLQYEFSVKQKAEKFESEKRKLAYDEEIKRKEIENANQKRLVYIFVGGFLVMSFLAFFIFRGLQQNKRAKKIIEQQKHEVEFQKEVVEEKNKEITDSINYAKRLQEAILPSEKLWKSFLPDSFILYLPKDIVAGDFYFMEKTSTHLFFAAADCTGHGVPGAMVSVVCSNALTRAVKEFNLTDTGLILNKTRELVIETFSKSEANVKDGMDISFVGIELDSLNKNQIKLQWSGANNPICYYSNSELKDIKPDKQPIGYSYDQKPFTSHNLILEKGDSIFIFTDGYIDQFGGEKGKKFKYSSLQKLLIENINLDVKDLNKKMNSTFTNWKGELEQLDDVCLIGIKL